MSNKKSKVFKQDSFVHVLIGDTVAAMEDLEAENTPARRRAAIRTTFAAVEGLLTIVKNHLAGLPLSPAENSIIKEESYDVDDRGNIKTRQRKISFGKNVKAVVKIICRIRPKYELDYNHPGWLSLRNSLAVRHRLMHPKCLEDLDVSDNELVDSQNGFRWFLALTIEAGEEAIAAWSSLVEKASNSKTK